MNIRWITVSGFLISALLGGCSSIDEGDMDDAMQNPPAEPSGGTTFRVTVENVSQSHRYLSSGAIAIPVGATSPGPLFPGHSYEGVFPASPGDLLSMSTMFVQSNDLFYSTPPWAIPLFAEDGSPREMIELTPSLDLYDAGTEANEEPGTGIYQAPRQAGPNLGPDDDNRNVRLATDDFGNLPSNQAVISAQVEYIGDGLFRLTVSNVSNGTTLLHSGGSSAVPLSPVTYVVHRGSSPLFEIGQPAFDNGLEAQAEDGSPMGLAASLAEDTGVTSPISPGVWAIHSGSGALFDFGSAANAGLEAQAEDGNPTLLAESLAVREQIASSGVFNTVAGGTGPGPAFPGNSYEFEVTAMPGYRLSFATMYVQSNDLFVSFGDAGLELFAGSTPVSGDVSSQLQLWDAGTEINQIPGAGPYQAPRQSAANTGPNELGIVQLADSSLNHPPAWEIVRVTVTPL